MIGNNPRGQAVVECCALGILLVGLISGLLFVGYLAFVRMFINYQLENASICGSNTQFSFACKRKMDLAVKQTLPYGDFRSTLQNVRSNTTVRATYQWGKIKWTWQKKLNLERAAKKAFSRWPCSNGYRC